MWIREFKDVRDVRKCMEGEQDTRAMIVEEYMAICDISLKDMEEDDLYVEELNGWLHHEMKTMEGGYEEYTRKN